MGVSVPPADAVDASELRDPLTGFGTRHKLITDLTAALAPGSPCSVLAIVHLGGFPEYVTLYGRLEGQDLLVRVADRLAHALGEGASLYRPRDDEFAALVPGPAAPAEECLIATASALSDRFVQFMLTLAVGASVLPSEVSEPVDALMLADERLYLNAGSRKRRERRSAHRGDCR